MTGPPISGPSPSNNEPRLTERDIQIHRVLAERDPHLAGLFLYLLRAMGEAERPGGLHMLGHAGRELSLGVLSHLAREVRAPTDEELNSIDREKEQHRVGVARALRLQPYHPSVSAWLAAHRQLQACAHYRKTASAKPPSASEALAAADALIALIWSRIGPFFQAREEIERLLNIDAPAPDDITVLHAALTRPAARWDFFRRLEHPGWVTPLLRAGFFKHPPDLLPADSQGRQRWEGWAEGDYLRRMASKASAEVRDALATIPETLRNPYVWDNAAEAAKAMPAEVATTLVPLFRKALKIALPWIIQETMGELAVQLAQAGQPAALGLARDVLRVVEGKPSSLLSFVAEGVARNEAVLFGLDEHETEELITKLADALPKVDGEKSLKFFIHRLEEALSIEWGEPEPEPSWDPSQHWCPDLAESNSHGGLKAHLTVAAARTASGLAAQGPGEAGRVLAFLARQQRHLFRRMHVFVLANAGQNAPEELNTVVADTQLVQQEYPPQEYLLLLESQFQNASEESRRLVIEAIVNGPGSDEEILSRLSSRDEEPGAEDSESDEPEPEELEPTIEDARKYRIRWQRKRLRRFGDNLPPELRELASRLNADTSVPKPTGWELELEDKGSAGGFGWSGGPRSPLTAEEVQALSPEQLLAYLRDFKSRRENFDSPTPAGLATALAARVREDPSLGATLTPLLPTAGIDRTYVRGVLEGLVGAAEDGRDIPWPDVLPLVEWVAHQANGKEAARVTDLDYGDANWRWAHREGAKLVALGASKNAVSPDDSEALWHAAEALIHSDATWAEDRDEPKTMDGALTAALNTVAGESTEALLDVALWNYRLSLPPKASDEEDTGTSEAGARLPFQVDRLRAGVDAILGRVGGSAYPAQVRLGQYLPQLLLVDREWVLERTPEMFKAGFVPPLTNPVWGGYITGQALYNVVFEDLRTWYLRAAKGLPDASDETLLGEQKDATWSTTRHLVVHCFFAVLRDLARTTDSDGLVPLVFERSPVTDRSHAFWEVFRGWKGPAGSVPSAMVDRLLSFWSWRLDILSTRGAAERKAEAGALGWLVVVKALPDDRVLRLLSRTAEQAEGRFPMEHSMWDRMEALAELDVKPTIIVVDRIVRAELTDAYPHFSLSDIGPTLKIALQSDDLEARQRAIDLVNLLGDNGFTEFGSLL
jgi:hypothetical protein